MGVLARCWHSHRARPIVVEVGEFVGEPLALVWGQLAVVFDHHVVRRCHCTLVDLLRDYQEVIPKGNLFLLTIYNTNTDL